MGKSDKEITFLGKDTEFEGSLRFEGTLRIDGSLQGEINSGGNLIIAKGYRKEKANVMISGEGTFRQNFELTHKTGSSFFPGRAGKNKGA